jgi:hypothetical protein
VTAVSGILLAPGSPEALAIAHVEARSPGKPVDPTLRITINFHPDRLHEGMPLLRVLAHDGVVRSQFETRTSNGGLTAFPGGSRWDWESRIFGRAYDAVEASRRPKYGALDIRRRSVGGSPRFGSAHFRLGPGPLARATFCYPDSFFEPTAFGTASRMSLVEQAEAQTPDLLDDYIEAHIHGPLVISRDVEALVLDPCYRGTDVEQAARELRCPIEWHDGFRLTVDELARHPDYRGPEFVALGSSLAEDGVLTPRHIGDAARAGEHDPQALKRVWHYVARFGGS